MSVLQGLDIGLAVLVLAVAGWTIVAREAFASVVGYVAYGLLLSLVWVRLFAVDVALTEAAIGSGVTGVLLISAAVRLRKTEAPAARAAGRCAAYRRRPRLQPSSRPLSPPSCCSCPIPARRLRPQAAPSPGRARRRQSDHRRADRLSLLRHHAREGRADPGRRSACGRSRPTAIGAALPARGAPRGPEARSPSSPSCCRRSASWSASTSSGSAPNEPGGAFQGGAILAAMALIVMMARPRRSAGDPQPLAAAGAGRGAGGVSRDRRRGLCHTGQLPRLSRRLGQAADPVHRGVHDAVHRGHPAHAGHRSRPTGRRCNERRHPGRTDGGGAGRVRPLRPAHRSAPAAQDPRLQHPGQRRLPDVRHHRAQGRGGRLRRRSRAAGDGHHRHRRRLLGHGARGGVAAAAFPGNRPRHAPPRRPAKPPDDGADA